MRKRETRQSKRMAKSKPGPSPLNSDAAFLLRHHRPHSTIPIHKEASTLPYRTPWTEPCTAEEIRGKRRVPVRLGVNASCIAAPNRADTHMRKTTCLTSLRFCESIFIGVLEKPILIKFKAYVVIGKSLVSFLTANAAKHSKTEMT